MQIVITVPSNIHADEIIEALAQRRYSFAGLEEQSKGLVISEAIKAKIKRIDECMTAVDNAGETL